MWETRSIPTEMGWTIIVLIPKGRADTRGIRFIEVVWKLVEAVTDMTIKAAAKFHDMFHGFLDGNRDGDGDIGA